MFLRRFKREDIQKRKHSAAILTIIQQRHQLNSKNHVILKPDAILPKIKRHLRIGNLRRTEKKRRQK